MNKDRAAKLLAEGLSPSTAASVLGCTPAYISQLLQNEEFKAQIAAYRAEVIPQKSDDELITTKYLGLEHKLLQAMESALPGAELPHITNALKVVADRQEKRLSRLHQPVAPANNSTQVVVQIAIPASSIPAITLNQQREVIAIDNQPMSPMASSAVQNLFKQKRAEREAIQQAKITQAAEKIDL